MPLVGLQRRVRNTPEGDGAGAGVVVLTVANLRIYKGVPIIPRRIQKPKIAIDRLMIASGRADVVDSRRRKSNSTTDAEITRVPVVVSTDHTTKVSRIAIYVRSGVLFKYSILQFLNQMVMNALSCNIL